MKRQAFTLVEILVTMAILAVVMTLLTVPLLSALGYVKKAKAISEAKTAALKAINEMKSSFEEASVIFDLPVTGEGITFLQDNTDSNTGAVTSQTMHRYMRILDFPWFRGGTAIQPKWMLLQPDFIDSTAPRYKDRYGPFHMSEKVGIEPKNPYIVASYLDTDEFKWSLDTNTDPANLGKVWNYRYPLYNPVNDVNNSVYVGLEIYQPDDIIPGDASKKRTVLERMLRNDIQSITPYGAQWDIPAFKVNPVRISNETLTMDKDASGNPKPGVVFSRNGLWAARNQILDEWAASAWSSGWYNPIDQNGKDDLKKLYIMNDVDIDKIILKDTTAPLFSIIKSITPFYPINTNPFGYKIKVHDQTGKLCYGTAVDNTTAPKPTFKIIIERHFMDWPWIGRDDFYIQFPGWATQHTLWAKEDIDSQRLAGKLVFSQPMLPSQLNVTGSTTILPIPTGWKDSVTYLSSQLRKITILDGLTKETFIFVKTDDPSTLKKGEFTYSTKLADKYNNNSRLISFGHKHDDTALIDKVYDIWCPEPKSATIQPLYYICDLQPTDIVTASYSTKGQIDLTMTLARQDTAARTPEQSRQDYSVSMRLEAKNAVRRALESR